MSFESVDLIVQIDWALDLPMIDELIPPRRKVQKSIKKRKKNCSFAHNFTLTTIVETPMSGLTFGPLEFIDSFEYPCLTKCMKAFCSEKSPSLIYFLY